MLHPEFEALARHADVGIVHSPTLSGQSAMSVPVLLFGRFYRARQPFCVYVVQYVRYVPITKKEPQ